MRGLVQAHCSHRQHSNWQAARRSRNGAIPLAGEGPQAVTGRSDGGAGPQLGGSRGEQCMAVTDAASLGSDAA